MKNIKKFLLYFIIAVLVIIRLIIFDKRLSIEELFDEQFLEFVSWMQNHGYSEEIINIYKCNWRDPILKLIIDDYFKIRRGDLRHPSESLIGYTKFKNPKDLSLDFIEVIPTDKNTEFHQIDPVTLGEFNKYLKERFGKNIIINHKKINLSYNETFGDIFYSYDSLFRPKTNPNLDSFMRKFKPPCIIRFDAEVINNKKVPAIWEIRHCAIMTGKEHRLIKDIEIFDKYAHEFGHSIGLDHQFIDPRNPPRSNIDWELLRENEGRYVGVDDIMIKSKEAENKTVGHYLSPLSRYALEPIDGYKDDDKFGILYNNLYTQDTLERIKRQACEK